jgi:hypothetical protein
MPITTLRQRPGINIKDTPILNELGWSSSQLIRFFQGLPQKRGGWTHLNTVPLIGTGRGMHVWADLTGLGYIAVGTEQRLQLFSNGTVTDITPARKTDNLAPAFTTTNTSNSVTITDNAHGASIGDWIFLTVPVAIGGLILQGFYLVKTVIDANNFTIQAARAATSGAGPAGTVPLFNTTMGSPNVSVTLAGHGYVAGNLFTVQISTTVGGIVMLGTFPVQSVTNANVFVIAPGPSAGSTASGSENGGSAQIVYLIPTGNSSQVTVSGYGIGPYGAGPYGQGGTSVATSPLRQWFLDNFGQDLIGNYTQSPIYVWIPPATGNLAVAVNTTNFPGALQPPVKVNVSFVLAPLQIVVALGCDSFGGAFDPNLIRWCTNSDFTVWQALTTNQAGSFRIPSGSMIKGGIVASNYIYIWTDIDMWSMQYIGFPLVFGFNKIATGTDLLSARCVGVWEHYVFWVSNNNFFFYDGNGVRRIACPVWDFFFNNLNRAQKDKVFCAVNSWFGEVEWYFPSNAGGGEVDSYVKFNIEENVWDFGMLGRTCWSDDNVFGAPIGADLAGLLQQHETGPDADGGALNASITSGYMQLQEGTEYVYLKQLLPDFILTGGSPNRIWISILLADYPTDTPTVMGPYQWTPTGPQYISLGFRARFMAVRISSSDLGVFWRLGALKHWSWPAGRL